MAPERSNGSDSLCNTRDGLQVDTDLLNRCIRQAFGLAKSGASSRAYLLLREGRERAAATLPTEDGDAAELLARWDTVLRWFERYAPEPG